MNRYERDRGELTWLLQAAHEKHPSHRYHRPACDVFLETGWVFSRNLAHKCCKAAGIRSKARKGCYKQPGEESILFPNQVKGALECCRTPLEDLNGWLTEGLYLDFDLAHPHDVPALLVAYVHFLITTVLPLSWAIKALFSLKLNGVSDKYPFFVSTSS